MQLIVAKGNFDDDMIMIKRRRRKKFIIPSETTDFKKHF